MITVDRVRDLAALMVDNKPFMAFSEKPMRSQDDGRRDPNGVAMRKPSRTW
jgi:hypothetical protein